METLWRSGEREAVQSRLAEAIVGSEATVKDGIERLARDTGANEMIIVTDTFEHADRIQSYQRVAGVVAAIAVGMDAIATRE